MRPVEPLQGVGLWRRAKSKCMLSTEGTHCTWSTTFKYFGRQLLRRSQIMFPLWIRIVTFHKYAFDQTREPKGLYPVASYLIDL